MIEVKICSKNQRILIGDLNDLTLPIVFDTGWASMHVDLNGPMGWKNSKQAPSWRFYLHCWIVETGSPGIICIVCHDVLHHPSEHGTSSMREHLLTKAHIAKLNEITESDVSTLMSSTVNVTPLAILERQGRRGITILCSQREFLFEIQVDPYVRIDRHNFPNWQLRTLKLLNFTKTRGMATAC